MKVTMFSVRKDEIDFIEKYKKEFPYEVSIVKESLTLKSVDKAKGSTGVIIIADSQIDREVLTQLKNYGVKFISSRSIGYDNIDIESAKEFGMLVSNSNYSPYSVSEYTIFYSIMLLRKLPTIFRKMEQEDFSLRDVIGKELWTQTIGVIGTGKIGKAAINGFLGMGCKVLAYDIYPSEELKNKVEYVELDELFERSDIITTHLPLTKESYHIINSKNISKMKDGVIIINTARGELVDTQAILDGLESGKIGGAAFDVLDNEGEIYRYKNRDSIEYNQYKKLRSYENVILTPHMSFYTEKAVNDMVYSAMSNMDCYLKEEKAPNNLIK